MARTVGAENPERDLLFHDTLAPHLSNVEQTFLSASASSSNTDKKSVPPSSPSSPTSTRPSTPPATPSFLALLRLTADSPDLLAIIKQEGRV